MQIDFRSSVGANRAIASGLACALIAVSGWTGAAGPVVQRKPAAANAMVLDVEAILNRWEPVAVANGASARAWREMFRTQLDQLPDFWRNEVAQVDIEPGDAKGSYARFAQSFVNARFNMVRESKAGKGTLKLGSATSDQVFLPIAPCRIVDTRNAGGAIPAGGTRAFYAWTSSNQFSWSTQGGVAGTALASCPGTLSIGSGGLLGNATPTAALATVTVVNSASAGNFSIWSGIGAPPTASALNWAAGDVLANTTLIPMGNRSGAALDFSVFLNSAGAADIVVDVVGYFSENAATPLQCATTTVTGSASDNVPDLGDYAVALPACPAGYVQTGSGCSFGAISGVYLIEHTVEGSFNDCRWRNVSGGAVSGSNFRADSRCCRVPGQ